MIMYVMFMWRKESIDWACWREKECLAFVRIIYRITCSYSSIYIFHGKKKMLVRYVRCVSCMQTQLEVSDMTCSDPFSPLSQWQSPLFDYYARISLDLVCESLIALMPWSTHRSKKDDEKETTVTGSHGEKPTRFSYHRHLYMATGCCDVCTTGHMPISWNN